VRVIDVTGRVVYQYTAPPRARTTASGKRRLSIKSGVRDG